MVEVEAKAKEVDKKWMDMEVRMKIVELEVERLKEELGNEQEAGQKKDAEIQKPRAEIKR
jgi:DNA modification methylase